MSITREQAAAWFETMHPPGPAAREMYRMAAEALRAQVVVDDSLAPRDAFQDDDGYIKYLIFCRKSVMGGARWTLSS